MKIEKCPFCGKQIAEIGNCKNMEECEHFEECPAVEPYVCVVCSINKGGCGASTGYQDGVEKAIAAWNHRADHIREVAKKAPLTLDELRQMDGEPVWIVTLDGTVDPIWEIIVSAGERGIDLICTLNGVETRDYADFDLYNDTWLAYRNTPVKEEHREAD